MQVRAAMPGMPVSEQNCHPFQWGRYMWMHNGMVHVLDFFQTLNINNIRILNHGNLMFVGKQEVALGQAYCKPACM